jgi:NAD(P)H-hydrate epimerase
LLGDRAALTGDAAQMARRWDGPVEKASADAVAGAGLIIDALFGAGLSRPLDGDAAEIVKAINASGAPVLAVDVPSGLNGTSGAADGAVVHASQTITFFRKKPGHVLLPGRALCGEVRVADIGIPDEVLMTSPPPTPGPSPQAGGEMRVSTFENVPKLWRHAYPWPKRDGHKYARGHALVVSGPVFQSGAARLAARGALRIGAGLVTVASPPSALPENAAHLTAIMLKPCVDARALTDLLSDARKNVLLIGPGAGVGEDTCEWVEAALASPAAVVLDADALTSYSDDGAVSDRTSVHFGFTGAAVTRTSEPQSLFAAITARAGRPVVMTPHEGEFKRLFGAVAGSKLDRAREAARVSGAVVILKGPDTVIAAPDGRAAINTNAPPWLATAGSGDVLAGFVTGLLAQGMPAFEAASAAVYLHGACGEEFGLGLIAEDLPELLPEILQNLHNAAGGPEWNYAQPSDGDLE